MNLQQLRESTRLEHEATEAAMPLMDPGLTLETYRAVLRTLLPVLAGWESWAAASASPSLRPLLEPRRRSHWLREDLAMLAGDSLSPESAGLAAVPPIDWGHVVGESLGDPLHLQGRDRAAFDAAFLGALYVVEGSTLGGRLIARHLEPAFGFDEGRGDAYLRGHGEATGALWRETTAAIAAVPDAQADLVIAAAQRTFLAFRLVLEQAHLAPATSVRQG